MKTVKIILANAPIKNGNRGCVALSVSAMALIDELIEKQSCDYVFYLPDSGYNDRQEHEIHFKDKIIKYYDIGYPFGLNLTNTLQNWCKMILGVSDSSIMLIIYLI